MSYLAEQTEAVKESIQILAKDIRHFVPYETNNIS